MSNPASKSPQRGGKIPPSHLVVFHSDLAGKNSSRPFEKVIKGKLRRRMVEAKAPANDLQDLESVACFQPPGPYTHEDERIYSRLGLAALHLTEDEAGELKKHPRVLNVVPNQTRSIKARVRRIMGAAEMAQSHAAGSTGPGGLWPDTPTPGPLWPAGSTSGLLWPDFAGGGGHTWAAGSDDGTLWPAGAESGGGLWPASLGKPWASPGLPPDSLSSYLLGRRDEIDDLLRRLIAYQLAGSGRPCLQRTRNTSWCLDMLGIHHGYALTTGEGIRVAVLDTGLDLDHPDFKRFSVGKNLLCRNFLDNSRLNSVADGYGHGTHCCGLIAGSTDPHCKVRYGVAPHVTLLVGKVLADDGSGKDSDLIDGIAWAAEKKAQIISLSLETSRRYGEPYSPVFAALAERLIRHTPSCLVVGAAGNDSFRPGRIAPVANPAACPEIMSVAAVDQSFVIAPMSCAKVDSVGMVWLSAPGVAVPSAYPLKLSDNRGYAEMSGTSMASAMVAGLTALFLHYYSDHRKPDRNARDIWMELVRGAISLGPSRDYGYGIPQAP